MTNDTTPLIHDETDHYLQHETVPVTLLDEQSDVLPSAMRYYPEDLALFFAELEQADRHYYAVIDASHSDYIPDLFFLEDASSACLLPNEKLEYYSDSGPWLFELLPNQNMLRSLMSDVNGDFHFGAILDRIAVFLTSSAPFDDMFGHLLEFTCFHNPEQACDGFFRFYDPRVLKPYLEAISADPGRLAAFFGTKKDIIQTIAFHNEDKSIFHLYSCTSLPDSTEATVFSYGEWEKAFFDKCRQTRLQRRLRQYLINMHPEVKSFASPENITKWCHQAQSYGYNNEPEMMLYLTAALLLLHRQIDIETWAANKKNQLT